MAATGLPLSAHPLIFRRRRVADASIGAGQDLSWIADGLAVVCPDSAAGPNYMLGSNARRVPVDRDLISVDISKEQIIAAFKKMKKERREDLIEDLIAAASPEYLESIREARKDYEQGHVVSHDDAFQ